MQQNPALCPVLLPLVANPYISSCWMNLAHSDRAWNAPLTISGSTKAGATIQCSLFERNIFLYGNLPLSEAASPIQKSTHSTYYITIQAEIKNKLKKLKTLPQEYHKVPPTSPFQYVALKWRSFLPKAPDWSQVLSPAGINQDN